MNDKNETKRYYDRIAERTFRDWFDNPELLPTLTAFVGRLPGKPAVLDLGCGTGGESKRLAGLGAKVTGVDFSRASLDLAREHIPDVAFIEMDIVNLDFPPATFDGVVEAGVLFHFTEDEQNRILRVVVSILKPRGRFLSYYPQGDFEGMQDRDVSGERFRRYARFLPKGQWIDQVVRSGFAFVTEHEFEVGAFRCLEFAKSAV